MLKTRKLEKKNIILRIFSVPAKKPKNNKYSYMKNGIIFLCDGNLMYTGLITLLKQCEMWCFPVLPYNYNITLQANEL